MFRILLPLALFSMLLSISPLASAGSIFDAARMGTAQEVGKFLAADPKLIHAKTELGSTPLHIAATNSSPEIAKLLLSKGADINAKDNNGATPLHLAAFTGKKDVAELLLKSGAIADAKDNNGTTPLEYAERGMNYETKALMVLWLLKYPPAKAAKKN